MAGTPREQRPGPLSDPDDPRHDTGGGAGDDPLRGEERARYGTDHAAGDGSDDALPPEGTDARGWFTVGLALFVVFLSILTWAVIAPFA